MTVKASDYDNEFPVTWCPGCGNFAILQALKQALAELDLRPDQVVLVSGIGQAGKLPHYMRCNFFNGLHGRAIPLATAVRIANTGLPVIVVGGDGDLFGEGGNHFTHALRRNVNLTVLSHNNQVFGLTKGQASPTAEVGLSARLQPRGVILHPFNPLAAAVIGEAALVARGFAGESGHLVGLIKRAVRTDGFALVDVLQPCVSFDRKHTFQWYRDRIYNLDESGHDPRDFAAAIARSREWDQQVPIGVFFENPDRPSYEQATPVLRGEPLVDRKPDPGRVQKLIDSFL
ncbi:MAG: 2-oxoacid:ferredoxin oxidoreductase subunit beta [Proteobacteria bacterium]|nr:2-oxoacid:ferredoxin oxidoreductase subunit beta [Pseudomonadota bacterium]